MCLDSEEHLLVLQLADQRQAEVLSWGRSQTGGLARRRSGTSGRHDPVVPWRRREAQRRRRKGGGALRQHRIALAPLVAASGKKHATQNISRNMSIPSEFLIFVYISKPNTMSDQNLWCRRLEPPGHCRRSEEEEGADSSEFPPRAPSSSNFTSPAQMFAKRLHQMD